MSKPPIAVILGAGPNGLGAVRSLRRERVQTVAVVTGPEEPLLHSRFPLKKVTTGTNPDQLKQTLNELAQQFPEQRLVVIPTSDRFVSFLTENAADLNVRFDFCTTTRDLSDTLIDKARETALIEQIGIPLPKTVREIPDEPENLIAAVGLPLIIKPRSFAFYGQLRRKNLIVTDRPALDRFYNDHRDDRHGLLAQEIVPGADDCLWVCNATFDQQHRLVSAFTFQRLRLSPSHFGVTSYAISRTNPTIVDLVERLALAIQYTGPVMVEFKFDARDGQYKYIELNPRLGMCNYFDTCCGVNNVFNAYQIARGACPRTTGRDQSEGSMYLCLWDDLYSRLKDGERVWNVARDYLARIYRRHVFAFFTWGDPMPGIVYGTRNFAAACASLSRKIRSLGPRRRAQPNQVVRSS